MRRTTRPPDPAEADRQDRIDDLAERAARVAEDIPAATEAQRDKLSLIVNPGSGAGPPDDGGPGKLSRPAGDRNPIAPRPRQRPEAVTSLAAGTDAAVSP